MGKDMTNGIKQGKEWKNFEKHLDEPWNPCYNKQAVSKTAKKYGGIAQLGERLNGIQEVSGSIPLISTKNRKANALRFFVLLAGFFKFLFPYSAAIAVQLAE